MELLYIGSRSGSDKDVIAHCDVDFRGIYCGKLRRYFSFENFLDLFKIPIGIVQSLFIITKFKPDVVFSKGGFVSVPVVIAAWMARKRIVLHESDVVPGLANKIAAKFASDVCVAFKQATKHFRGKAVVHVTGNPVRSEIASGLKGKGDEMTGFNRELPVIMVMGGSQGAQQINKLVWRSLKKLLPVCQIIHICGKGKKGVSLDGLKLKNYKQFEFLTEGLPDLYAITDLVISRAGANSLAEIALLKKPSVLIPLPLSASRGDQIENAKVFEKAEVSVVLDPDAVNADEFSEVIVDLVTHVSKLQKMEKNYEDFAIEDAVGKIVELLK